MGRIYNEAERRTPRGKQQVVQKQAWRVSGDAIVPLQHQARRKRGGRRTGLVRKLEAGGRKKGRLDVYCIDPPYETPPPPSV